jgi:hypothetical protein
MVNSEAKQKMVDECRELMVKCEEKVKRLWMGVVGYVE